MLSLRGLEFDKSPVSFEILDRKIKILHLSVRGGIESVKQAYLSTEHLLHHIEFHIENSSSFELSESLQRRLSELLYILSVYYKVFSENRLVAVGSRFLSPSDPLDEALGRRVEKYAECLRVLGCGLSRFDGEAQSGGSSSGGGPLGEVHCQSESPSEAGGLGGDLALNAIASSSWKLLSRLLKNVRDFPQKCKQFARVHRMLVRMERDRDSMKRALDVPAEGTSGLVAEKRVERLQTISKLISEAIAILGRLCCWEPGITSMLNIGTPKICFLCLAHKEYICQRCTRISESHYERLVLKKIGNELLELENEEWLRRVESQLEQRRRLIERRYRQSVERQRSETLALQLNVLRERNGLHRERNEKMKKKIEQLERFNQRMRIEEEESRKSYELLDGSRKLHSYRERIQKTKGELTSRRVTLTKQLEKICYPTTLSAKNRKPCLFFLYTWHYEGLSADSTSMGDIIRSLILLCRYWSINVPNPMQYNGNLSTIKNGETDIVYSFKDKSEIHMIWSLLNANVKVMSEELGCPWMDSWMWTLPHLFRVFTHHQQKPIFQSTLQTDIGSFT
ncbi:uncharacterized protein LOC126324501 [Schistocerca gregaria]|uniref:uncharacterized protein LOC126324501 n=1 Tax=Schistocerca gregaria TaxID=7010 RepID=UPI00211EF7EE|nr:uncharacterized protein LOC126324501 [Schistocerca gregaria]